MSGNKILDGARGALDWAQGNGTARVTMPGQPAREMTVAEVVRAQAEADPPRIEMMRRLCLAAERASRVDDIELTDGEVEAIVRAVLMELSQPTEAMIFAGMQERNLNGSGPRGLPLCFSAMVKAAL